MVHAENGDAIDVLVKQALAAGNTAPHFHALTRPPETEGEATNRAIQLARVAGAPLYVVHVSCREAVEPIAARASRAGTSGARRARSTSSSTTRTSSVPTSRARSTSTRRRRGRSRTRRSSGTRCARTSSPSISTDHCAFLWDGQKSLGKDDFSKIPNGGPGLENRLHMIHEFGVRAGPHLAEPDGRAAVDESGQALRPLSAQGHHRAGLGCRTSWIFDPERRHLITAADQHSKTDYNLYEGTEVTGSPEIGSAPRKRARRGRRPRRRARRRASSSSGLRSGRSSCPLRRADAPAPPLSGAPRGARAGPWSPCPTPTRARISASEVTIRIA